MRLRPQTLQSFFVSTQLSSSSFANLLLRRALYCANKTFAIPSPFQDLPTITPFHNERHNNSSPYQQKCFMTTTTTTTTTTATTTINDGNSTFRFAGIQMDVTADKQRNLEVAHGLVKEAATNGAKLVSLPECFNSPYATASFPQYAETVPEGPSSEALSSMAKEHGIYLIGGSIPERENDKVYNSCLIFGPGGSLIARHRKVHLFDIDVPGRIRFKESETLSAGSSLTVFDAPELGKSSSGAHPCRIGVGICYDLRFPEYAQLLMARGCDFLVYPGAFNLVTGPAHWELLLRGRALDNQLWVAGVSPARSADTSGYQAWGHSSVISPWGEVMATTEHSQSIIYADVHLPRVAEVRSQIPVSFQKRFDVYLPPSEHTTNTTTAPTHNS